jgi:TetR/AcrR family tetracycline transcriptional repressor
VKTKQSLIASMADAIVGSVAVDDLPDDPIERVWVVIGRYRQAMLSHRDGGRLVAGTYTSTDQTLRVAEVIVGGLLSAGYSDEDAARLCWALVYFTLGLTQEQQTTPPAGEAEPEWEAYPALAKSASHRWRTTPSTCASTTASPACCGSSERLVS